MGSTPELDRVGCVTQNSLVDHDDRLGLFPVQYNLSRPFGQVTPAGESFSQFGGLVKTTFRF